MMMRAAEILESEKDSLAHLMTLEMGKTLRSAVDEAVKCAWVCRYYAENAERFLADEPVETPASRSFIRYQPMGPVLVIMPWNYPFWQAFRFIAPGLMAGNVGLLKHASNLPQCAMKIEELLLRAGNVGFLKHASNVHKCAITIEELLLRAGVPEGVFQTLLVGAGSVDRILGNPSIAAATLTGSEGAGVKVGTGAAQRIKKVVLELGGSDPFIVMPSANLEDAVAVGIKARVANNGQSCIAAKRFIVHEQIADKFQQAFVAKMESLKVGDPCDEKPDVGPLATPQAVPSLDADVRSSIKAGAKLLPGAKPADRPGSFYLPTVLTDIPKDSAAYKEELFGPVASIFRVKNIDEAIRVANDSRFGLGASAWTNDKSEQERFINELEAGMVFINQMVFSDPRVPFGGVKRSGIGRELSTYGIREFTNVKTVWVK